VGVRLVIIIVAGCCWRRRLGVRWSTFLIVLAIGYRPGLLGGWGRGGWGMGISFGGLSTAPTAKRSHPGAAICGAGSGRPRRGG